MSSTVTPVDGATYFGTSKAKTATQSQGTLNMQSFLNLLVTQMQNQDPTNPMSDSDFYAQIAQLGQVQGLESLNNEETMVQAQALMGTTVTATRPAADTVDTTPTVSGVATGMKITDGTYVITLSQPNGLSVDVPMTTIQSVTPTNQTTPVTASGLIGATVTGTASVTKNGTTSSQTETGVVTGVLTTNGVVEYTVKTTSDGTVDMPVSSVTSVTAS